MTIEDLMVVHNMGRSCPACTLQADGYTGIHPHVASRCSGAMAPHPLVPEYDMGGFL